MDKYRIEPGSVYEYNAEQGAYLRVGRLLPGEPAAAAVRRIQENRAEAEAMEAAGITPDRER